MLSRTEYSGLKGKCVGLQAHLYPTQISHSNPRITVLVRDGCGIHELSFAEQPASSRSSTNVFPAHENQFLLATVTCCGNRPRAYWFEEASFLLLCITTAVLVVVAATLSRRRRRLVHVLKPPPPVFSGLDRSSALNELVPDLYVNSGVHYIILLVLHGLLVHL